ncbi:MAG: DegT/DnrJ/EryC1/StrS family aminotransferase [Minisyncoccia bacterium]
MKEVKFLDLKANYPLVREEISHKFEEIIDGSSFVSGKYVLEFENEFAKFVGAKHCVAVDSGTAALYLALLAHGIGEGDEVIVPVNTFIATAEAVSLVGAVPVFVDNEESTYNIDVSKIEGSITARTKAIIPVHLYGTCASMDEIITCAQKHGLLVIEDACQAHGASYKNAKAGSIGATAAFSFYPGKNLGAWGEGGAVTTSDDTIAQKLILLRNHGSKIKYQHEIIGGNFRMSEFQGAVLSTKLPHLESWNEQRRKNAALYAQLLGENKKVVLPLYPNDSVPVWHLFVIRVSNREALMAHLQEKGIGVGIHYPVPLHLTPAYSYMRHAKGEFPVAEKLGGEIVSLPMYPELSEEDIKYVSDTINEFLQ